MRIIILKLYSSQVYFLLLIIHFNLHTLYVFLFFYLVKAAWDWGYLAKKNLHMMERKRNWLKIFFHFLILILCNLKVWILLYIFIEKTGFIFLRKTWKSGKFENISESPYFLPKHGKSENIQSNFKICVSQHISYLPCFITDC